MSLKEIIEANKKGKLSFGIKQVLKLAKEKKLEKRSVFICRDTREETAKKLENANVEFEVLKNKKDIAKEIGINFESEVLLI